MVAGSLAGSIGGRGRSATRPYTATVTRRALGAALFGGFVSVVVGIAVYGAVRTPRPVQVAASFARPPDTS
jgi:hypothetical protein